MTTKDSGSSGGVGFCGLLLLMFIGLKLTGHITWSWWWILSPFWIPFSIAVLLLVAILTLEFIEDRRRKR
jgi:predicted tellurium resistance membrane protein TerC